MPGLGFLRGKVLDIFRGLRNRTRQVDISR